MPESKKISELPVGALNAGSLFEASIPDSLDPTDLTSNHVSATDIGNFLNGAGVSPLEYNSLLTGSKKIIGAVNEVHNSIGADVYDSSSSYVVGDYCIYNNTLYRCKSATSGAWDSTKWEAKTITSLIESNSSDINKLYYKV